MISHIHLVCNISGLVDDARLVSYGLSDLSVFRLILVRFRQYIRIVKNSMVNAQGLSE